MKDFKILEVLINYWPWDLISDIYFITGISQVYLLGAAISCYFYLNLGKCGLVGCIIKILGCNYRHFIWLCN